VTYQADDNAFQVGNQPGKPLPVTGGPGTTPLAALGALLTLAAVAILLRKRRIN
jgi:LPXTG-motif cell wall-anchored protein